MDGLQQLIDVLGARGYSVVGPTVRDGAIVPGPVRTVDDLPRGWGDEQDAAHYRLRRRDDDAVFGFAAGAQSPKPVFFPASELFWRGRRTGEEFTVNEEGPEADGHGLGPYALIGVRSCDLHALAIHDVVLLGRNHVDVRYAARRDGTFVVAATCSSPGGTCFCASMGTGPRADAGYDLALTELLNDGPHRFLVEVGTPRGAEVLDEVESAEALPVDVQGADDVAAWSAAHMGRTLDTQGIKDVLYANAESPRWDDVASRCLACTNCTLVCPTCFCTSVEDVADLTGDVAERRRVWDSCFTQDFSYIHGGSIRPEIRSRYRQWMTHKLAAWIDQFGTSGCVGCGRCITWCPAAIDITAEAAALRWTPQPAVTT
ncbi:MAG TPA: 4Fe-4S dicluster domain-containing protein [Cellulomonas sp.]|uniref:4Fe-4S dicluster domain-containing protein n=1 Tax=Cellulomonas sp. TaxID=40001 RepID=UPI002E377BF5|nr:4Fe-4S dicluster domain-containing protein [Cellulomonas sp.]HEX5333046.1 4Fe-4S dicluster domain-containing protein [Cellulomonas sp.]